MGLHLALAKDGDAANVSTGRAAATEVLTGKHGKLSGFQASALLTMWACCQRFERQYNAAGDDSDEETFPKALTAPTLRLQAAVGRTCA